MEEVASHVEWDGEYRGTGKMRGRMERVGEYKG